MLKWGWEEKAAVLKHGHTHPDAEAFEEKDFHECRCFCVALGIHVSFDTIFSNLTISRCFNQITLSQVWGSGEGQKQITRKKAEL